MNEKAWQRRVRQHVGGRDHGFFAVVQPGFEETAAAELKHLPGLSAIEARPGGVAFGGRLEACHRVNLCSHSVSRVLLRLAHFHSEFFEVLRRKAAAVPWELFLPRGVPLRVEVSSHGSALYHAGRIETELRGAIAERLAGQGMEAAAAVDADDAQLVLARLDRDECQLSLDSSGGLLYRRGLGKFVSAAPLRETAAAGILLAAGVDAFDCLIDPMAGAGTFSLEAGMLWQRHRPGMQRGFAFERWPAFSAPAFAHLKKQLKAAELPVPAPGKKIILADRDRKALDASRHNLQIYGLEGLAGVSEHDFFSGPLKFPAGARTLLVLNPPYGERLGQGEELRQFFGRLGATVRRWYGGCAYAVIVPGHDAERALDLPHEGKITFNNGGIPVAAVIHRVAIDAGGPRGVPSP